MFQGSVQPMLPTPRTVRLTKFQKKWRIAGIVVHASLFLVKRIFSKNGKFNSQVSDIALASPRSSPTVVDDETKFREMVKSKNLAELQNMGDVEGIAKLLETNTENGINGDDDDLRERRVKFGSNTNKNPPMKGLIHFVVQGFMDNIILILLAAGVVNLVFGILVYGVGDGWYDGGTTIIAVVLLVLVSAGCNFRQTGQLDKLQKKMGDNINFEVVRDGKRVNVSISDMVVGDVVFLNVGDHVPADGLFIDGYGYPLVVDEPDMTGESVHVDINSTHNPFLLSGSRVAHGCSKMLVVGIDRTNWGQKTMSITTDSNEQTPLQERLENLTSTIRKIGLLVALVILVVLLIHFITEKVKYKYEYREFESLEQYIFYIINSVAGTVSEAMSIVVVAVPGGLDLAFMLALANTLRRMMADRILVRKFSACETMGSTTVICTNKTGTLTLNEKKVTKLWIGNEEMVQDFSRVIPPRLLELLHQGVAFNTTCSIYEPHEMEKAILSWAIKDLGMDIDKAKQDYAILGIEVFNSRTKQSGVHIRSKTDNSSYVHRKGAAEIVLAMCSYYYEPTGELRSITETERSQIENIIEGMASSRLQCVAFAYRKMKPMATESLSDQDEETSVFGDLSKKDLTLLGIIGIKDSSRPNARKGVQTCRVAGVDIKLITSDNLFAAKAIASDCGILEANQQVAVEEAIEGIEFRSYTAKERLDKVDKIRIMANSSPSDKHLMVQCLKQKGHVVAVTRDGTNDADMLKEADTVLCMGSQGIETAKERQETLDDSIRSMARLSFEKLLMVLCIKEIGHVAVEGGNNDILPMGIESVRENSNIAILNDDFSSVTTVLKWGRCIYCNVQKYIQFQLTFNIAIVVIYLIAAFSGHSMSLTNFQLLWADLIMEKLGAFALATERPDEELMLNPPIAETEPIITNVMWRNMLAQALYQISVLLTLQFHGMSILKVDKPVRDALIFNTLVLCQVFNLFNSRKLEKKNVFEGIHKRTLFLVVIGIIVSLHVVMIECLRLLSETVRLSLVHWGISVAIATMGLPIGLAVKLVQVPEKPFLLGYFSCIQSLPAPSDELLGYFEVASEIKNEVVEAASIT